MKKKYSDITGIILSGGLSFRMGSDKALLSICGRTIIERTSDLMNNVFENILISTNNFEAYRFLGHQLVEDQYKDFGPISGIHASLVASVNDKNFILSCDMPLMSEEMIRHIIEFNSSKPISIPATKDRMQPLCGVYSKSLIPAIVKMINDSNETRRENGKNRASVKQLIEIAGAEIIETKHLPFYNEDLFFNMNSTEDFDFVKKKMSI